MSQDSDKPLVPETEPAENDAETVPGGERPAIHPPPLAPDESEDIPIFVDDLEPDIASDGHDPESPAATVPPPNGGRRFSLRRFIAYTVATVAVVSATFTAGYYTGWHKAYDTTYDPFTNYCSDTPASLGPAAMHRRNQIWRAWNGEDVDEDSMLIAAALAVKLRPDLDDPLTRLLSDLALKSKWVTRTDESGSIKRAMESDSQLQRAIALIEMMKADAQAGEIIRQVLCDFRRLSLFMQKQKVPLETLPNGTAP